MLGAGTFAAVRFTVVNQRRPANSYSRSLGVTHFEYENENVCWGFSKLLPLAYLGPAAGFLVGNRLKLKVELAL